MIRSKSAAARALTAVRELLKATGEGGATPGALGDFIDDVDRWTAYSFVAMTAVAVRMTATMTGTPEEEIVAVLAANFGNQHPR